MSCPERAEPESGPGGYCRTEKELERQCIRDGQRLGFIVHRNSQRRFNGQAGYTGETEGLPDTVGRRPEMPVGIVCGVELKKDPKSKLRPKQKDRLEEGFSVVARTPEAFCRYLLAVRVLLWAIPPEARATFEREVRGIGDLEVRDG